MGFDKPDEPIKTKAERQRERKEWEKAGRPKQKPIGSATKKTVSHKTTARPDLAKTPEQLEAGFAQQQIKHGVMPAGSAVVSRNADGSPETYKYQGQVYYAPGSTMYQMGWRSREDYMRGQRVSTYGGAEGSKVPEGSARVEVQRGGKTISVSVAPGKLVKHRQVARLIQKGKYKIPVTVYSVTGQRHTGYIAPQQQAKLDSLENKQQFNYMLRLGMMPQGSTFGKVLEEGRGWTYYGPPVKVPKDYEAIDTQLEYESQQRALERLTPYSVSRRVRDGQISSVASGIDIVGYLIDHPNQEKTLLDAGFSSKQVKAAQAEAALSPGALPVRMKTPEQIIKTAMIHPPQKVTAEDLLKSREVAKNGALVTADILVPGVWARHWNKMETWERAICIAGDALLLLFGTGAILKGARAGAVFGRAAMLKAMAKGASKEAIAQLKAPVTMILHPIGTAQAAFRQTVNLAENIAHKGKIPYAVLTTSEGAVRIPVTNKMTAAEAMAARDILIEQATKGERLFVQVGNRTIELTTSPFMREARQTGGGLVHATPDIGAFAGGAKVRVKPSLPTREQGWFLSPEPLPRFAEQSAFGGGKIPVPAEAGGKVVDIAKFRPADIVRVDKAPIRELNFADAINVPEDLARQLQQYAKKHNALLYGSFNEWLKLDKAVKPNDIDLVFRNADKSIDDIVAMAKKAGYDARRVPHGVEILKDGQWVKLGDIVSMAEHKAMLPGVSQAFRRINGLNIETLGKQYIGQSYGAIKEGAKALTRAEKLEKAAGDVRNLLKAEGAEKMRPGFFVTSRGTAEQTVSTGKLFHGTAEVEKKLKVGADIPKPKQRLFTRLGPNADRVEILLERPLTARQIARLKAEALVETIKAPFTPAIRIKNLKAEGLTVQETRDFAKILRQSGNVDQAAELIRLDRQIELGRVGRALPRLASVTGRVSRTEIQAARQRLLSRTEGRARLERLGRAERMGRLVTPERLTRTAGRVSREIGRGGRVEYIVRLDRNGRLTRTYRAPVTSRAPGRVARTERTPERPRGPERPREPERPERPERPFRRTSLDEAQPSQMSGEQKREYIELAGGAVGLRMGELHGKDNWLVRVYPYTGPQFRLFGRKPKGAKTVKGPGSGYESAFLYGTPPDRAVNLQSGFQSILLVPSDGSIRAMFPEAITPKPPRITPSPIRISPRPPRITPKPPRITPKPPRITR